MMTRDVGSRLEVVDSDLEVFKHCTINKQKGAARDTLGAVGILYHIVFYLLRIKSILVGRALLSPTTICFLYACFAYLPIWLWPAVLQPHGVREERERCTDSTRRRIAGKESLSGGHRR